MGWSQLGWAGASPYEATIDAGDIERSIAGAGICSIDAEQRAGAGRSVRRMFLPRRGCSLLRSGCELLPRSRNQRGNAPGISGGAKVDAGDIDRIIGLANFSASGAARSSGELGIGHGQQQVAICRCPDVALIST
jgi:hypothetical protein